MKKYSVAKVFFFRHLRIFRSLVILGMSAGFTSHSWVEAATFWLGVMRGIQWNPGCGCRVVGSDYGSSLFFSKEEAFSETSSWSLRGFLRVSTFWILKQNFCDRFFFKQSEESKWCGGAWWIHWLCHVRKGGDSKIYTPGSTNIAGWKMDPKWRCISYWKWGYSSQLCDRLPESTGFKRFIHLGRFGDFLLVRGPCMGPKNWVERNLDFMLATWLGFRMGFCLAP